MADGYRLPMRDMVSQSAHAMIEAPDIPRSRFKGTWTRKTTFDAGLIVPFMVDEVLPGDMLKYDVTAYVRMATPLFPLMDQQKVETFFFFVPCRLVWSNWQRFMGEQDQPGTSIDITLPTVAPSGSLVNTLYDQMGVPVTGFAGGMSLNALPFRAYRLIYREWFRDENLIDDGIMSIGDGPDSAGQYVSMYRRAKSHDYFTSALPWPQKFTAPSIPLTGTAPVTGIGTLSSNFSSTSQTVFETNNFTTTVAYPFNQQTNAAGIFIRGTSAVAGRPSIFADLSQATATFTINALRQAWMVQSLLERDARGGTRYTEIVRSHFRVQSPDARLNRPEYIGGGSTPLHVTPVAQTAPSSGVPVGALGAAATATGAHSASVAATEHGYVIGLINVRSELSYGQGLHRMWSRRTRYDFYWPSLAGLGEQAILRQELFYNGTATDTQTFGFQERWHEYRARYSEVTGAFRSGVAGTLDAWHLGQNFAAHPTLGQTFIEDSPPMTRVLAAGAAANNQQYLADILIRRDAVRPIPTYGTPATIGRF